MMYKDLLEITYVDNRGMSFADKWKPLTDFYTNRIKPIFDNVLKIGTDGMSGIKKKITELLGNLTPTFGEGGFLGKITGMITHALDIGFKAIKGLFSWLQTGIQMSLGGYTVGFWIMCGIAGAVLLIVAVKLAKYLMKKNESLDQSILPHEQYVLSEAQEAGFITRKILNSGVDACKDMVDVTKQAQQTPQEEQPKTKSFIKKFALFMLVLAAGSISVLSMCGFFSTPGASILSMAFSFGAQALQKSMSDNNKPDNAKQPSEEDVQQNTSNEMPTDSAM